MAHHICLLRLHYEYLPNWLGKRRALHHDENWNTANLPPFLPNHALRG